ncbi:MAG: hypothetical protein OXC05_08760 [Halieaceae bacterium]|nr:hypothetical protein [Halieaceae bacterium]
MPLITGIIADGNNPYTRPFQPQAMSVYPPLYNIVVAPLSGIFGNTLLLHRLVSAFFIAVSCGLCALAAIRNSGSRIYGIAASVCLYAALLFYSTPIASTNALGMALFLATVLIPWFFHFSNRSLALALLCGLLAFYTKQYFVVGVAMVCLYVFLFQSMIRALTAGMVWVFVVLFSLVVVHHSSPYFLDNTIFSTAIAASRLSSWALLFLQLKQYAITYWGLLAIMTLVLLQALKRSTIRGVSHSLGGRLKMNVSRLSKPLSNRRPDYFWFCFFWGTAAIVVSLGRNPGNYMTYLFQLMSPFLLIAGFGSVARLRGRLRLAAPLVLAVFFQAYTILPKDFSTNLENWRSIDELIARHDEILASQMLLINLIRHGKEVYQDGHTFYFPLAQGKPKWFVKELSEQRVEGLWEQYLTMLYEKVRNKEFDLVIVSPWDFNGIFISNPPPYANIGGAEYFQQFYYVDEKIRLSMTDRYGGGAYDLRIWRPKP